MLQSFVVNGIGCPLYNTGAKLYSLVFAKVTPESFKRACARALKE
jgi:hypothetical protein